ncbi:lipopolysaccharide biosynthesis protein [Roseomonas sp. OT10]|uniref:lipopolysaccharide biosynthesis protein n=1 Tax=Roseomonas cutis TaxID=2897332 RepID=UPI001E62E043|nr:lipopolysaccharide biosynthesis protein [Roseomonas sp. OT10]UFN49728.1 lipopolysaccharide biosynthesis protein [Roseomonas sp. OT10]
MAEPKPESMPAPPPGGGRSSAAFKGVFWSAINILVPTAANLLVFVVTSRLLTPNDFGQVALAASLAAFASALVPAGFGEALVQRKDMRPEHMDGVFWLCLLSGLVTYAALAFASPALARFFGAPSLALLLPVLGLRVISDVAAVVPQAVVLRALSFHLVALRTMVATLVASIVSVALVLAGFGLWALVFAQLANSVVATISLFWTAGWRPRWSFRGTALRELTAYGAYASGTRALQFLMNQADQAVVGFVLGTVQLGLYNFARRVFAILNDVTSGALSAVAHPLFSGIQDDLDRVRRGFLTATLLSSIVAFPLFVGLALVADRAVPLLFGAQWVEAVWPIRILCGLGIITCIGMLQAGLINSLGRANWWFWYQLFSGVTNFAIVFAFASQGTTVMLAVMVAKTYLFWPVPVGMTLRLLAMRPGTYATQFAAPLAASALMAAAVLAGRAALPELDALAGLAVDVALGALVYGAALALLARRRLRDLVQVLRGAAKRKRRPAEVPAPDGVA